MQILGSQAANQNIIIKPMEKIILADGTPAMDFGEALRALKDGQKVFRYFWNSNHVLGLQKPDANSANTAPYIYMVVGKDAKNMAGVRVPWVASQTDLLEEDWFVQFEEEDRPMTEGEAEIAKDLDETLLGEGTL